MIIEYPNKWLWLVFIALTFLPASLFGETTQAPNTPKLISPAYGIPENPDLYIWSLKGETPLVRFFQDGRPIAVRTLAEGTTIKLDHFKVYNGRHFFKAPDLETSSNEPDGEQESGEENEDDSSAKKPPAKAPHKITLWIDGLHIYASAFATPRQDDRSVSKP